MKHKIFFFFSIAFVALSSSQLPQEVEAANYDTEIGLTFNRDVAAGSNQSTDMTSESTADTTSESSTNVSNEMTQYPETGSKKPVKSGITSLLPSTGYKNNNLYLLFGFLILIIGFLLLSVKRYISLKKKKKNKSKSIQAFKRSDDE